MHYAHGAAFIPRGFPGVGKALRCSAAPRGPPLLPSSARATAARRAAAAGVCRLRAAGTAGRWRGATAPLREQWHSRANPARPDADPALASRA